MDAAAIEAPSSPIAAKAAIDAAIAKQVRRKTLGVTGMAVGVVVIVAGMVIAQSKAQDEADAEAARGEDGIAFEANWAGLLVGLPIAAYGAHVYIDAKRQMSRLSLEREGLARNAEAGGLHLKFAFAF